MTHILEEQRTPRKFFCVPVKNKKKIKSSNDLAEPRYLRPLRNRTWNNTFTTPEYQGRSFSIWTRVVYYTSMLFFNYSPRAKLSR